ncbi:MAG: hypothetical protein IT164_19550 [Bryobacterales bacterium]|nr:hypothetical protein [Bryobacterales bacterium]
MTTRARPWLFLTVIFLSAAGGLPASGGGHKKEEAAPAKKNEARQEAKQEAKHAPAAPIPAPAASQAPKAVPTPRPAARPAPVRPVPRRRPAASRRPAPQVTATASPPPAEPASQQPSTAVIHLVTHAAGDAEAAGLPVPPGVARPVEDRGRIERAREEWSRAERASRDREQALEERERALEKREEAARRAAAEASPPEAHRRMDRNLLTNEGLVRLAEAGYDEVFLMDLIRRKTARFDTSVEGLTYLMKAGLSQQLVRAVLALEEWERARRSEELAGAAAQGVPEDMPSGMKPVRQKLMVPGGQLRAGERGRMMLAPSGERWYWVPDAVAAQ